LHNGFIVDGSRRQRGVEVARQWEQLFPDSERSMLLLRDPKGGVPEIDDDCFMGCCIGEGEGDGPGDNRGGKVNLAKPFTADWSLAGVRSVDEGDVSEENIMLLNEGSKGGMSTLSESFHDEGALLYLGK